MEGTREITYRVSVDVTVKMPKALESYNVREVFVTLDPTELVEGYDMGEGCVITQAEVIEAIGVFAGSPM
jgi:hypothetical protein